MASRGRTRATVLLEDGVRYEGHLRDGEKAGRGTLYFPEGSSLTGVFRDGALNGFGWYTAEDGDRLQGRWTDGELNGKGEELSADGELLFRGEYCGGVKHGRGTLYMRDGGVIVGNWDQGELSGDCGYFFRGGENRLCRFGGAFVGQWKDGDMLRAYYVEAHPEGVGKTGAHLSQAELLFATELPRRDPRASSFRYDPSTSEVISSAPLLRDPYETRRVYVKASEIAGGGEGLFAKIPLRAGEIAAFYSGIRLSHETVDTREWTLNDNTLSMGEESDVIDVPISFIPLANYSASLGHKANHSSRPNAAYVPVFHPRFGDIKCVRMLSPCAPDAEVTVDYGYDGEHGYPAWWQG